VRVACELFLREPGHGADDLQADLRNLKAGLDLLDGADGLGVDARGRVAVRAKERREGHAVARRMGAGEQLFGIGAGQIAKARAGAIADRRNRLTVEGNGAAAGRDIARPDGLRTSVKHHRRHPLLGVRLAAGGLSRKRKPTQIRSSFEFRPRATASGESSNRYVRRAFRSS